MRESPSSSQSKPTTPSKPTTQENDCDTNNNLPWYLTEDLLVHHPKPIHTHTQHEPHEHEHKHKHGHDHRNTDIGVNIDSHADDASNQSQARGKRQMNKRTRYEFENDDSFLPFTGSVQDLIHKSNVRIIAADGDVSTPTTDSHGVCAFLAGVKDLLTYRPYGHIMGAGMDIKVKMMGLLFLFGLFRLTLGYRLRTRAARDNCERIQEEMGGMRPKEDIHDGEHENEIRVDNENDHDNEDRTCRIQTPILDLGVDMDGSIQHKEPHDPPPKQSHLNNCGMRPMSISTQSDKATTLNQKLIQRHRDQNQNQDFQQIFTSDIPAMARVIAASGLDEQESLKIATREVLASQRRALEENRKEYLRKLDRARKKLEDALMSLRKNMASTVSGRQFMFCLFIGCTSYALSSTQNQIILKHLWSGHYGDGHPSNHFEVIYKPFLVQICGCLDPKYCGEEDSSIANEMMSEISFGMGMNSLNYGAISTITSLLYPNPATSIYTFMTRCMMKALAHMMIVGVLHRILRIFQSDVLHHLLNMVMVIRLAFKIQIGRYLVCLMMEIWGFNMFCSCVAYSGMVYFELFRNDAYNLDHPCACPSMTGEEVYTIHRKLVKIKRFDRDLFIVSSAGSIILGSLPVLSSLP